MESETLSTQKFSRNSLDKVMTSRKMDVTISTEEIWREKKWYIERMLGKEGRKWETEGERIKRVVGDQ